MIFLTSGVTGLNRTIKIKQEIANCRSRIGSFERMELSLGVVEPGIEPGGAPATVPLLGHPQSILQKVTQNNFPMANDKIIRRTKVDDSFSKLIPNRREIISFMPILQDKQSRNNSKKIPTHFGHSKSRTRSFEFEHFPTKYSKYSDTVYSTVVKSI